MQIHNINRLCKDLNTATFVQRIIMVGRVHLWLSNLFVNCNVFMFSVESVVSTYSLKARKVYLYFVFTVLVIITIMSLRYIP